MNKPAIARTALEERVLREKRIRRAAILVLIGMVVTLASILIAHPLSFLFFLVIGLLLVAAGIVSYLLTLLQASGPVENGTQP